MLKTILDLNRIFLAFETPNKFVFIGSDYLDQNDFFYVEKEESDVF